MILIYSGSPRHLVEDRPVQIVRATSSILMVPLLFGAALASGADLDGNGINGTSLYASLYANYL